MFSSVLIANRGEIACRIIKTCQKLGITSIAIYSNADEHSLHVKMADRAINIGGASPAESYLNIQAIIKAAKKSKAEAIHPGYGFLSENPSFVEAVEQAGIIFIGPSSKIIQQMGDKVEARKLAIKAGVPVIPGTEGEIEDAEAVEAADQIGYPLMIKAADGGGGMGIRVVRETSSLLEALAQARSQAKGAFGSSRVYIERRVENASHVEVQVMGDQYGNAIHLYERDCSVQRRNQKVVEETPCAKLKPEVKDALLQSAVMLTKDIGYSNAGTIEYLLDGDGEHFYFLEMNTRLQVEHPITEMVTGVDLVELQLRVASGEPLPLNQNEIEQHGAAIEARIYPEDPVLLLPTAGTVTKLDEPSGYNVRVDSALYEGYEVSPYYEPMMSKLIVRGKDRDSAISNMVSALNDYVIEGPVVNIPLIKRVVEHKVFKKATFDNGFLEELLNSPASVDKSIVASIALSFIMAQTHAESQSPSKWRLHGRRMAMVNRLNGDY
ncbi:MAG: biotin carboxylase [Chloroflexi bacterium]|nr:biotin carboxylase [Chloroflexota bacterium]|tara:strand:+ start:1452 stop:2936 length:1485 start_codon:yes stop_codon:yes gene_type:complete